MTCPVCRKDTGTYFWPSASAQGLVEMFDYPLYQRSYPEGPMYISPRCEQCFDKAVKGGE